MHSVIQCRPSLYSAVQCCTVSTVTHPVSGNIYEMSGTDAKLAEDALKLGRALGVLANPKVRRYAGIARNLYCINLKLFPPPQSPAAMKQAEKYVQNAMKNKLCVEKFYCFCMNRKHAFVLRGLNATCCRHEFGDESL